MLFYNRCSVILSAQNAQLNHNPRMEHMDKHKLHEENIVQLARTLTNNMKEDMEMLKNDIISSIKRSVLTCSSEQTLNAIHSERRFMATLPLPSNIYVDEKIEVQNGAYHVTFTVKCGVRYFSTTCYLGEKPDEDILAEELRNCINNAVKQCLDRDRGQIHELGDSDKVINIQSL